MPSKKGKEMKENSKIDKGKIRKEKKRKENNKERKKERTNILQKG